MSNTLDVALFSTLYRHTPKTTVVNNAGLAVRQLMYWRSEAEKEAMLRVNLQRYDTAGYLKHSVDARLAEHYLQDPKSTIPNQSQVNTRSGVILQSKNVDAGMRISISDVRGLIVWTNDSLGNERTFKYDKLTRVTSIQENIMGKKTISCERFVYGDNTAKTINGIGRLLKHYDAVGLREKNNYSVLGNILNESRQFLENTETTDWSEDLTASQILLEQERYTTQWQYNALGETISQTDTKANKQSTQYGIAGEFVSSRLQLKAGTEQTVINKQTYSAAGQLLEKHLANGVVINYSYEEKTQRLGRLHSLRLSDNKSLQDLNYHYDPVGNILEIIDKAKEPGFYANQQTEAINQYRYDSLYQLIEASGLESQQAAKENATRNPALRLGNPDASRCVNYTRRYDYDAGGNLYAIQHRGTQRYTQRLSIDATSNRGIVTHDSGLDLVKSFDANGNLLYLNTEQPLQWDSRNQLQQVTQLKRETHSDVEVYRYEASGQRVEKLTQSLAENQLHYERVRYSPGIELREHWQTDIHGQNKKITEQLHVIQSDSIRVLHWEMGKPNDMENDGFHYTLTDLLGSTQLELNAKSEIISVESYYPYGGTAIWATKNSIEAHYKFIRYSGKERDATGLYYYGYRYYIPWLGRWVNPDPSGIAEGLNLFCMVGNNPITFYDSDGKTKLRELYSRRDAVSGYVVFDEIPRGAGRYYRDIRTISIPTGQKITVNVKAWEEGPTGKEFYLLKGEREAKRLVVDSHGAFDRENLSDIGLTPSTPKISYLNPHETKLIATIHEILESPPKIYAQVSYEKIELTSFKAVKDFEQDYTRITGSRYKKRISDYLVSKYKVTPTANSNWQHILQVNAYTISTATIPTDILTVRTAGFGFLFKDILKFAEEKGYTEVVCGFCRNAMKTEAPPYFNLKSDYLPAKETVIKSFKPMPKKPSENSKLSLRRFFRH